MKTIGDVKFEIEKKEDLEELLYRLEFSFLPSVKGKLTQVGGWISDVRPHLCLLEFVKDQFQPLQTLRKQDPDVLTQFNEVVDELVKLKEKFKRGDEMLDKYKDE